MLGVATNSCDRILLDIFVLLDVTVSSNSELEQLHIKSSDTSVPAPLAHDYMLSASTSDDIKQWYKALQESRLLDNVVLNCRKRSQPSYNSREVCIYIVHRERVSSFVVCSDQMTVQLVEIFT